MSWLSNDAVDRLSRLDAEPIASAERYRVIEEIGRGGMGVVYRAEDRRLGREVALKVLHESRAGAEAAERLRREAEILARLEHPGIVPVHDVGTLADGRVFYAMRHVRGERLDRAAFASLSRAERLRCFIRICDAVAFAHHQGVVHRDLKPENVMLGPFGDVLVMDWGVAKVLSRGKPEETGEGRVVVESPATEPAATMVPAPRPASRGGETDTGTVLGTPRYMAPEQRLGDPRRIGAHSDVYALGAVLHYLLTGSPPPADPAAPASSSAPRPLESIRRRAMAPDPAARYAGAAELAADVARFLDGDPVRAHRETPLERVGRWLHRYRVPVMLVVAYLIMRGAFFLWFRR